jgi:hypothetical protein
LSNRPLADADIGWHIRTGEQILATHSLPRTDPFSSTMQGQPWFAWEWLYDIAARNSAPGLRAERSGVAVRLAGGCDFRLAAFATAASAGPACCLAIVLMLLAEAAAMIHLYARPHIVSWLFSLLWFVALERWERWEHDGATPRRSIAKNAAMDPLVLSRLDVALGEPAWRMAVRNSAAWNLCFRIRRERGERTPDAFAAIRAAHRARAMAFAWVGSAVATLVNPYGWRLHEHIYRYLGDRYLMNHIDEFRSPDFHGWAQRAFAVILMLVWSRLRAIVRSWGLSHLLVVLLAAYAGFYSSRNLPVSSMLLVLIAGRSCGTTSLHGG